MRRIATVAVPAPSRTMTSVAPAPAAASPQAKPLSWTITLAGAALAGRKLPMGVACLGAQYFPSTEFML